MHRVDRRLRSRDMGSRSADMERLLPSQVLLDILVLLRALLAATLRSRDRMDKDLLGISGGDAVLLI